MTIHWSLLNDYEFLPIKLLKNIYRRGDQTIQTFCRFFTPQKLDPPALICQKFNTLPKVPLSHAGCIDFSWLTKNLALENSWSFQYRKRDQISHTICKISSPQKLDPPSLIYGNFKALRKVLPSDPEWIGI